MVKLQRIVIYGSSGAGKTTLAKTLGELLSIQYTHLDDVFWFPDWQPPTKEFFRKLVQPLLDHPTWIIDGNYSKVRDMILPKATFGIVLDLPLYVSIWRIILRTLTRNTKLNLHASTHLPTRIAESGTKEKPLLAIYELSAFSTRYKLFKVKGIIQEVHETLGEGNYIVFKSPKQVKFFIKEIERRKGQE